MSTRALIQPMTVSVGLVAPTVSAVLNLAVTPLAVAVALKTPTVLPINVDPKTVAVALKVPTVV